MLRIVSCALLVCVTVCVVCGSVSVRVCVCERAWIVCVSVHVQVRKEILVATRHILSSDFRGEFLRLLDVFLDERLLIGDIRSDTESLRPLALSTLADLVHHVRGELTPAQMNGTVAIFSRNIHDPTLPLQMQVSVSFARGGLSPLPSPVFARARLCVCVARVPDSSCCPRPHSPQTTSVRLLLNLVSNIYRSSSAATTGGDPSAGALETVKRGRSLLSRILFTLVHKFGTLQQYIPRAINALFTERDLRKVHAKVESKLRDNLRRQPEDTSVSPDVSVDDPVDPWKGQEEPVGSIKDIKSLIKTMTLGLKTVVWCLSNLHQQQLKSVEPTAAGKSVCVLLFRCGSPVVILCAGYPLPGNLLAEDEMRLLVKFLKWGLRCFQMLGACLPPSLPLLCSSGSPRLFCIVACSCWVVFSPSHPLPPFPSSLPPSPPPGGGVGSGGICHFTAEELKETMDHFAGVFIVLEPHNFRDLFQLNFKFLFGEAAVCVCVCL